MLGIRVFGTRERTEKGVRGRREKASGRETVGRRAGERGPESPDERCVWAPPGTERWADMGLLEMVGMMLLDLRFFFWKTPFYIIKLWCSFNRIYKPKYKNYFYYHLYSVVTASFYDLTTLKQCRYKY